MIGLRIAETFKMVLIKKFTTMKLIERIKEAKDTIINMATLPPQIDYISPWEKQKVREAEELINSLPTGLRDKYNGEISRVIDSYYYAEDENGFSAAYYDSLF